MLHAGEKLPGRSCRHSPWEKSRRVEGQGDAEVGGTVRVVGSHHELLRRASIFDACDNIRLQSIQLRAKVDGCHAAVERLHTGGGIRAFQNKTQKQMCISMKLY